MKQVLIAERSEQTIASFWEGVHHSRPLFLLRPRLPLAVQEKYLALFYSGPSLPGIYLMTSGTSGEPKLAYSTFEQHLASAKSSNEKIPLDPEDVWHLNLPLYHVGGISILFRCALAGATASLTPSNPITHLSAVPTQLYRQLKENVPFSPSLKALLVGGGPIPSSLIADLLSKGVPAMPTYGLTEMNSQVATAFDGVHYKPLPSCEIQIDGTGEILLKGPSLFSGYWTAEGPSLLLKEGYFPTGDLGAIEGSSLKVIGRRDRLFISGGENIHPEEIEARLLEIPGVKKALVAPVKCDEFGARPVAYLTVSQAISEGAIISYLEEKLPRFKIPDQFFLNS